MRGGTPWGLVTAILGGLVIALFGATASRAAGVDLTTGTVQAPAYAHPGGRFVAAATARTTGAVAASSMRFYFSANRTHDARDIRLEGRARVLAFSDALPVQAGLTVPAAAEDGEFCSVGSPRR